MFTVNNPIDPGQSMRLTHQEYMKLKQAQGLPSALIGPLSNAKAKLNTKMCCMFQRLMQKHKADVASMWWVVLEWHHQVLV